MSMMDHYPSKKRRLSLNSKTPTRPNSIVTVQSSQQFESPKVSEITLPKKKHKASPAGNSTDESTVEIHWDNNSPSQVVRPKRGRPKRSNKNKSLSSLIKQMPKTRKSVEGNLTESNQAFSTWMQQNLAPVRTRRNSTLLRQNSTRSSLTRGSKIEALDFNEKIKKFLNDVQSSQRKSPDIRVSPCMIAAASARQQTQSPSYFSNSSADSLLNFDDNLEDSLLMTSLNASLTPPTVSTIATSAYRKTPLRSCRTSGGGQPARNNTRMKTPVRFPRSTTSTTTTPVLTRSARKQMKRPVPRLATVDELKDSSPLPTEKNNSLPNKKKIKTRDLPGQVNKPLIDNFDEEDDFDEILSTQPDILLGNNEAGHSRNNNNDPPFTRLQKNKNSSTAAAQVNKPVPTISTTPDLLDANDADEFDDLLASFDMDDIKCKSQDSVSTTTIRLSESQRKLKTKCHTSPLPLNYKQKKLFDQATAATSFVPISKSDVSSFMANNNRLDNGMQSLSIHSPSACTKKTIFHQPKNIINGDFATNKKKNMADSITSNFTDNTNRNKNVPSATNKNMPSSTMASDDNNNINKKIANNFTNTDKNKNNMTTNAIINNNLAVANTSFVRTNMVTKACRKPFVPPKQSQGLDTSSTSIALSDMTLDLSAIQGGNDCNEAEIPFDSIPFLDGKSSMARSCFSSTQKCSMQEIEQKRKFAQTKLRERLRRKRK